MNFSSVVAAIYKNNNNTLNRLPFVFLLLSFIPLCYDCVKTQRAVVFVVFSTRLKKKSEYSVVYIIFYSFRGNCVCVFVMSISVLLLCI